MAEVVVISAETFSLSAGPLYISSLLIDHGYSVDTLQMLDEFSHDQIRQLVDKYIETPYQIIAVSLTFARSMRALQAVISNFINEYFNALIEKPVYNKK